MSLLLLLVAALGWVGAHRSGNPQHTRLVALAHGLAVFGVLIVRGDLPPAGWVSALAIAGWVPGLWAALWPDGEASKALRLPTAMFTLLTALLAANAPGPGVGMWSPWALPHILPSVLGFGAAVGAALLALQRIRGQRAALLTLALVLTLLPLSNERSRSALLQDESGAAVVQLEIDDPQGEQGTIRSVPARAPIPYELWFRVLAAAALAFGLFLTVAGVRPRWLHIVVVGGLGLHVLYLLGAALPRDLGIDPSVVGGIAERTVALEAQTVEQVRLVAGMEGPFVGGLGAVALLLPLALLSGLFTCVAFLAPHKPAEGDGFPLYTVESRLVAAAALLLAVGAVSGMVWSNYRWGGPSVADPKVFATGIVLVLYGTYFMARSDLAERPTASGWIAVAALLILMLSMLGSSMGLLAPTLHFFGA